MYMTARQRRAAYERRAARVDALILGGLLISAQALAYGFIFSPIPKAMWIAFGGGA